MDDLYALQRLNAITEELQAIRDRVCATKSKESVRYHSLSMAVSGIRKAAADIRGER
jgi:hypothetical protein